VGALASLGVARKVRRPTEQAPQSVLAPQ